MCKSVFIAKFVLTKKWIPLKVIFNWTWCTIGLVSYTKNYWIKNCYHFLLRPFLSHQDTTKWYPLESMD